MKLRCPRPETAPGPPRHRRRAAPATGNWPAPRSWPLQARAAHESVGLVLVSLLLSAGRFWGLALR